MESVGEGLSSLIHFAGISVPARARFVWQTLASTTFSAVTMGFVCGQIGASIPSLGPLVPFLCGSWVGYTFGLIGVWRSAKKMTLTYAKKYPTILAHALMVEWDIIVPRTVVECTLIRGTSKGEETESDDDAKEDDEGGTNNNNIPLDRWICNGGLGRLSWSILAAQGCHADIIEVQREERQRLMDMHKGTMEVHDDEEED